jgi:hypothetical protein
MPETAIYKQSNFLLWKMKSGSPNSLFTNLALTFFVSNFSPYPETGVKLLNLIGGRPGEKDHA